MRRSSSHVWRPSASTSGDADAFEIVGVIGEGAFGHVHYARGRQGAMRDDDDGRRRTMDGGRGAGAVFRRARAD